MSINTSISTRTRKGNFPFLALVFLSHACAYFTSRNLRMQYHDSKLQSLYTTVSDQQDAL